MTGETGGEALEWKSGVPVSSRFGDPYYSLNDGLAETRHVFLDGNRLEQRFAALEDGDEFHICELGFGTGLNFLATLELWRRLRPAGKLRFTSFELYPLDRAAIAQALAVWPSLASEELMAIWPLDGRCELGGASLELVTGDARATLPWWQGPADAWFLDGFAPARNPELWEPELLGHVHRLTKPGGSLATYTAAGAVRRALEASGFLVSRENGFGKKRHMTRAVRPE